MKLRQLQWRQLTVLNNPAIYVANIFEGSDIDLDIEYSIIQSKDGKRCTLDEDRIYTRSRYYFETLEDAKEKAQELFKIFIDELINAVTEEI